MEPIHCAYFPDPIKVDSEAGYPSPDLLSLLRGASDLTVTEVTLTDVLNGRLTDPLAAFTVLCVPGGFVYNYASKLGRLGAWRIRDFVARGGGFIGICAGAFLGSTAGLGLLPVSVVDIHRYARGCGPCQLRFTEEGCSALGAIGPASTVTVRYHNGPVMATMQQLSSRRSDHSHASPSDADGIHLEGEDCGVACLATFASEFRALHQGISLNLYPDLTLFHTLPSKTPSPSPSPSPSRPRRFSPRHSRGFPYDGHSGHSHWPHGHRHPPHARGSCRRHRRRYGRRAYDGWGHGRLPYDR